jgi:hypothetical protein
MLDGMFPLSSWISTGRDQNLGFQPGGIKATFRLSSFITKGSPLDLLFFGNQPSKRELEVLLPFLLKPTWSPIVVGNRPQGIKQASDHLNITMMGEIIPPHHHN